MFGHNLEMSVSNWLFITISVDIGQTRGFTFAQLLLKIPNIDHSKPIELDEGVFVIMYACSFVAGIYSFTPHNIQ